ncbi:DUF1403 family protein [Pseudorhodobacter sp. E13]|uniref:DUF1403 family protein n=1 Tax=Pseudorhodobacter sp. E13 TaxID=2487931 RepID=UPI000F8EF44E|nr:DUF1403 family protein [Pseudorhodobacter sp. E13]RUS64852.1 DUF1403 family protein [Pseudorhodobacter sp. E13]
MHPPARPALDTHRIIYRLPQWIAAANSQEPDSAAFNAGAALATLDWALRAQASFVPAALLRDRLALEAAVACLALENRRDTVCEIRDALCLARPEEALGPAGDMFMAWRRLTRINLTTAAGMERVAKLLPPQLVAALPDTTRQAGTAVAGAAHILTGLLQKFPRQEAAALMLADVALAQALRWDRVIPLLAAHLKRTEIRSLAQGTGTPERYGHAAMVRACATALGMMADLGPRAERLRAIAPKLRAKGAEAALSLFLSHDAVSPSAMLSPMVMGTSQPMTDRAARRLCDRLVSLGGLRELTGRATFRLYGV